VNDIDDEVDAFLAHFGVKGMRWGVRKNTGRAEKKTTKRSMTTSEKAGIAFSAALLAAYGTLTLAAIKM
jgi:hypothetical protein